MKTTQLNHVAIHVEDVERSSRFYSEILHLAPIPRPAFDFAGAWFRLGDTQELHIIGSRDQPVFSHRRGNHFALLVDDIHAWLKYVQQNAVGHEPLRTRPDGAYQLYIKDPDGHVIELCTPPGVASAS